MANYTFSMSNAPLVSDAAYRTWGSTISNALTQVLTNSNKIVSTIDWNTITAPAAGVTSGYEVWKLNDPGHASSPPVYMKFTFGGTALSGGTYYAYISLNVGTGWNGSALSGPGSGTSVQLNVASNDSASTVSWMSSDGDGFAWLHSADTTAGGSGAKFFLVVDRQRNANGIAQANTGWPNIGYMVGRYYAASSNPTSFNYSPTVICVDPVANEAVSYSKWPIISRGNGALTSLSGDGLKTLACPMWNVNRQGSYTSKMVLSIPRNDVNNGSIVTLNFLNANRQYKASSQYSNNFDFNAGTGSTVALWWGDV